MVLQPSMGKWLVHYHKMQEAQIKIHALPAVEEGFERKSPTTHISAQATVLGRCLVISPVGTVQLL